MMVMGWGSAPVGCGAEPREESFGLFSSYSPLAQFSFPLHVPARSRERFCDAKSHDRY